MILRCTLDGLLLEAEMRPDGAVLVVHDGDEAFDLEALEAQFYELVAAAPEELLQLEEAHYRLLRLAEDFSAVCC